MLEKEEKCVLNCWTGGCIFPLLGLISSDCSSSFPRLLIFPVPYNFPNHFPLSFCFILLFFPLMKHFISHSRWLSLKFSIPPVPVKYCATQKLPQIFTANHGTFPIQIRKITVQICGNFWSPSILRMW